MDARGGREAEARDGAGLLAGLRVLDVTDERGHQAGRILSDLGADVIKVEPPGGDPLRARGPFAGAEADSERSLAFLAANAGKRSIVLDLAGSDADRDTFRRLVGTADVVIETHRPGAMGDWGLGYESLRRSLPAAHPGLVYCAITPFGQTGPYAGYAAHDLVLVAMGGNASMTGSPERPPLRCSLPTAYMHAAPEAVVGILTALHARERGGGGQRVDISMRECQLSTLITGAGQYALDGEQRGRAGYRIGRTREIWRCRDGYISYGLRGGAARAANLAATVAYMAEHDFAPDWLREMDWEGYSPLTLSDDELERLESAFAAFFETQTMRVLYEQALVRRILLAPCNDAREVLAQPQLRSRGFFARVARPDGQGEVELPGFFARSSARHIGVRGAPPGIDEHGAALRAELESAPRAWPASEPRELAGPGDRAAGIFANLKILELGAGAAGPVATRYFAEQGATVIRIESARRPDFLRVLHVTRENRDDPDVLERAPMFVLLNPDKQSLANNMKEPEGVALVRRLVGWADVVAENFAPGVMARWGLDYEALATDRPDLVMVSGCLFGQTGPQRGYPGFGGQGAAIAGFNHMTGWPDGEALGPYATITDSLSPRYVALALIAALIHRDRTGEGQSIDVSQIETGVYGLAEMIVRHSASGEVMERIGNRSEHAAPHGIYPCLPGPGGAERWIAIAAQDDAQWAALVEEMGRPAWAMAPGLGAASARIARAPELDQTLSAFTRGCEAEALMARLQAVGVEAGVVRDLAQLQEDPQLAARGHFVTLRHDPLGELRFERTAIRLSASPGRLQNPGPRLGEHTHAILSEILGLEDDEIERLVAEQIAV